MVVIFLVMGILFTISAGAFLGLAFTRETRNKIHRNAIAIIIALLVGFGISGFLCLERKADIDTWNNSYCECGGKWELFDVECTKSGSNLYFYKCEECGKVIKLHANFTK